MPTIGVRAPEGDDAAGLVVVLGSGYAGLTIAQLVHRRSRGKLPVVLVDRNPVHELRTRLYQIDQMAKRGDDDRPWALPLVQLLEGRGITYRGGTVRSIDLAQRSVLLDSGPLSYRTLAICLGNEPAYYGVPGAAEHTHHIYRLSAAQKLARALLDVEVASSALAGERRPRVVVVGGGSTGTELAAEIATADWSAIAGAGARPPEVVLVTGSLPFLAGVPPPTVERARALLGRAGVSVTYGWNVVRVDPGRLELEDGSILRFDIAVWCAGLEASPTLRALPVPHGKGGRIQADEHLAVPDFPDVFAVGDAAEVRDPDTGVLVPGTAQAALQEARVAAENIVRSRSGGPLATFRYRERGTIVAVGTRRGAGHVGPIDLWGRPALVLKRLVERDYSRAAAKGEVTRVL